MCAGYNSIPAGGVDEIPSQPLFPFQNEPLLVIVD
jgi:hypothetical protein